MSDFDLNKSLRFFVASAIDAGIRYADYVRSAKRTFIQEVLDRHHGNQSKAARELGMHRNTLQRTMQELGMWKRRSERQASSAEASVA